jgi:hypothetical protein
MAQIKLTYDKEITALLVVDPYNDFISQRGKIWDRIRGVAEGNDCVPHMLCTRMGVSKKRSIDSRNSPTRWSFSNLKSSVLLRDKILP